MNDTCYYCGNAKTSRDHCPPLCIFPADKDVKTGISYRKDLITVPACDLHNLKRSKDDEYLMMVIAANYSNNDLAKNQVKTKVLRAWQRKPHIAQTIVSSPRAATLNGEETMTFKVDMARFDHSMESITRGLIFHETGNIIDAEVRVRGTSMLTDNLDNLKQTLELNENISFAATNFFSDGVFKGNNPEIFKYQIYIPDKLEDIGFVKMVFYEGFDVFAFIKRNR